MLRNCEKMVLISSTPNEWPQPQQQQACKRYWTRGGTLRNVPVGGGCRKNKRVKRPPNNNHNNHSTMVTSSSCTSADVSVNSGGGGGGGLTNSSGSHIQDLINGASSNHHHNHPLFYGLPTNSDINFPFSRYDLHQNPPQINGLGLGFSSSGLVHNMNTMNIHNNSHPQNTKQIFQDLISSSNPTTTTTTTNTSSISSLLASSLHQIKGGNNNNNNNNHFQTLLPSYEDDLQMKSGMYNKGVKMEFQGQNRASTMDHHHWNNNNNNNSPHQTQMDQTLGSSSDPSSILWGNGAPNFSAWLDPSNNIGSSVPSLI
ncbi:Dof zinc finger protein DOF1.4 [Bienertia sinuspersici]